MRLIKKEVYSDYIIELNEYDLTLLIKGLTLLDKVNQANADAPCLSYEWDLLEELKGMQVAKQLL